MAPGLYKMPIWKGNTFSMSLALKTRVGSVDTPVDLTGSVLVFRMQWSGGALTKSTADDDGFTITDAANGLASLTLTVAETRALPSRSIQYEIERRIGSTQTSVLYGHAQVTEWVNGD